MTVVRRGTTFAAMDELSGYVVVDLSQGLSGAYCAKLFSDSGATVIRCETADGDPQRHQQWSGTPTEGDAPLWRYLRHGQQSLVVDAVELSDGVVTDAVAHADVAIISQAPPKDWQTRWPSTVFVCISPYGTEGPDAQTAATEFTLQADSGAVAIRGTKDRPPVQMGGRIIEWVGGAYAGVSALAAAQRSRTFGVGEFIDVSLLEVANITATNFADLFNSLAGRPPSDPAQPPRSVEIPSIEPTKDGWVGFNTNTRDQWESFCLLIERPDLIETAEFALLAARSARADEWNAMVREFTTQHTTAEIVERAAALRIPVAPVSDGESILELDHPQLRGVFLDDPTHSFKMPRRPFAIDGEFVTQVKPAPAIGEHSFSQFPQRADRPAPTEVVSLPLAGLRVLDLTAWWAGPSAAGLFAALGADVVHVESTRRIDGMRTAGGMFYSRPQWWEYSAFFLQANTNKFGLTLDLDTAQGRELALELVAQSDVVIENFTPRVVESFNLDWDVIRQANPNVVMVRMPAFGLDGPWRDRPGFAQTMEQITGLAWMTGHRDDQPRIQRGPCDPNGGLHAAFATLVGLEHRKRTGRGCLVEAPMFEAALNVAAEPVIEWTAHHNKVERDGNRSPYAAPQNLYPCQGIENWLAVSVETNEQFVALCNVIGRPDLAADERFATLPLRRQHHDELDVVIGEWASAQQLDEAVAQLRAAHVPAAITRDNRITDAHPQTQFRHYSEVVDHPVVGRHPVPTLPFRFASVESWIRRPAPTIGQHNDEILGQWLGRSEQERAELLESGVIGDWPMGVDR